MINNWLDAATDEGTDHFAIQHHLYSAGQLAEYHGCDVPTASNMLQSYREYNYWMDPRCLYVIAHEGRYGPGAPWRLLGTKHDIAETTRRLYRLNQVRHLTWDFFDHAKKEIKSFGAENRQGLVAIDWATVTQGAERQRFAIRDYARDLLQRCASPAQSQAASIIETLRIPAGMKDEYLRFFFDGFWPYVEVMVDEEVKLLESMLTP